MHKTIKKVTDDIENLQYNTAISALMILFNKIDEGKLYDKEVTKMFIKLLAPFAPYLSEELWREILGSKTSIHCEPWPIYDAKMLEEKTIQLVVQVNGKHRATIAVPN